ncbi:MAG: hypothetical protein V4614_11810 [Pseudomonadota bacterium]
MKTIISKTSRGLMARPRYLRAIPSLVVLTTAMAWGMSPDTSDIDSPQKKPASPSHTARLHRRRHWTW